MPKIRLSNKLFVFVYTLLHTYRTTQTSFFSSLTDRRMLASTKSYCWKLEDLKVDMNFYVLALFHIQLISTRKQMTLK